MLQPLLTALTMLSWSLQASGNSSQHVLAHIYYFSRFKSPLVLFLQYWDIMSLVILNYMTQ